MNLVILNKSFGDVVLFFDGMLLQDYWCETTGYVVGKIFSSGHYAVRNCCPVSRRKRIDTIKPCPTFKVGHSFGREKTVAFLFFWESTCWPSCAWKILLGRFCCAAYTQLRFSRLATCFFSEAFAVAFQCLRPLPPFAGG